MSPLPPFELDGGIKGLPNRALPIAGLAGLAGGLKKKGKALFKLRDIKAAAEFFKTVLTMLEPSPTVGETHREEQRVFTSYE